MAESGEGKPRVLMVLTGATCSSQDRDGAASQLSFGGVEPMGAEPGLLGVLTSVAGETFSRSSLGEVS